MNKSILHINTYTSGGAAKACLRINNALINHGCNSNALVLYKAKNNESNVVDFRKELMPSNNLILKFKNKIFAQKFKRKIGNTPELFSSYSSVWDVHKHSLFAKSDILHLHWVSGFINFPKFFANTRNKKLVITLHDFFPFSGGFHYPNQFFNNEKMTNLINENLNMLKSVFDNKQIDLVGPSAYILKKAKESDVFNKANYVHVPNPVDHHIYHILEGNLRAKYGFKPDDKIVLFVNENLEYERKGYQKFKSILKSLLENNIKVIFVGDIDKSLSHKNIIQTGYITDENKLAELYNCANCLAFTSQDDNLPNTIAEAHSCGLPVVSFAVGGVNEMINEQNGFLVSKNNLNDLQEKINLAVSIRWNRNVMAEKAKQMYNAKLIAESYLKVYRS